jgi:hypothetical protein
MPSDIFLDNDSIPSKNTDWGKPVFLSRDIIQQVKKEQRRTGLTPYALLRKQNSIPDGLTGDNINNWFDMSGRPVLKIPFLFIDYVLKAYRAQPDTPKRFRKKKRIPIDMTFLKKLESELNRTGCTVAGIFKGDFNCPEGLTLNIVGMWRRGNVKKAFPHYMEAVLEYLECLPDKSAKPKIESLAIHEASQPIATLDLERMQQYRDILGILPGKVFDGVKDVPVGLNRYLVSGWLNENSKTAQPDHVDWILKRCHELVSEAYVLQKPEKENK